jgi:hypothetical protein
MNIIEGMVNGYKVNLMKRLKPELDEISDKALDMEHCLAQFCQGMDPAEEIEALALLFPKRSEQQVLFLAAGLHHAYELEQLIAADIKKEVHG